MSSPFFRSFSSESSKKFSSAPFPASSLSGGLIDDWTLDSLSNTSAFVEPKAEPELPVIEEESENFKSLDPEIRSSKFDRAMATVEPKPTPVSEAPEEIRNSADRPSDSLVIPDRSVDLSKPSGDSLVRSNIPSQAKIDQKSIPWVKKIGGDYGKAELDYYGPPDDTRKEKI